MDYEKAGMIDENLNENDRGEELLEYYDSKMICKSSCRF